MNAIHIRTLMSIICLLPLRGYAGVTSGTFELSGMVTIGFNGGSQSLAWTQGFPPFASNQATVSAYGLTGTFLGFGGSLVSIADLMYTTADVGASGLTPTAFVTFADVPPTTLLLDFIALGGSSSTDCNSAPAVGQTCTVTGSPFAFENTVNGGSRATFNVSGTVAGGSWRGDFAADFEAPYQDVLFALDLNGFVATGYTGRFAVGPAAASIPEPAPVTISIGGFALLAVKGHRRKARPVV